MDSTTSWWDTAVRWISLALGALAGLYGQWSGALTILCVLMAVDYITGVMVAATGRSPKSEDGGLSSKIGFIGLAKKGFIMLIVLVATQLDKAIGNTQMIFQTAAVFYYIANEGLSILENAHLMDVPFPEVIRMRLESMKEDSETSSDQPAAGHLPLKGKAKPPDGPQDGHTGD